MEQLGEPTLKPFLQDVIQLGPLVRTMGKQASRAAATAAHEGHCGMKGHCGKPVHVVQALARHLHAAVAAAPLATIVFVPAPTPSVQMVTAPDMLPQSCICWLCCC